MPSELILSLDTRSFFSLITAYAYRLIDLLQIARLIARRPNRQSHFSPTKRKTESISCKCHTWHKLLLPSHSWISCALQAKHTRTNRFVVAFNGRFFFSFRVRSFQITLSTQRKTNDLIDVEQGYFSYLTTSLENIKFTMLIVMSRITGTRTSLHKRKTTTTAKSCATLTQSGDNARPLRIFWCYRKWYCWHREARLRYCVQKYVGYCLQVTKIRNQKSSPFRAFS